MLLKVGGELLRFSSAQHAQNQCGLVLVFGVLCSFLFFLTRGLGLWYLYSRGRGRAKSRNRPETR